MRAGGCSIHQSLTPDAAAVVKQAIGLARRRGHAQVTPLHVVNTMLSSSTGLLRSACLQSHSHPLQCKALELCFNVALNRLPAASSSSPLLPPQHPPSLSNALIAAFKRAQAHQRRGSIENQQQPLLSVKIELEQLIVSILDDPSVSRVMREAGFSSTQVKSNVEHAISSEPNPNPNPNPNPKRTSPDEKSDEDVSSLVESLVSSKRRSIVVVGECLASAEGVVKGLMERIEKGQVPEILRNLQFITLPLLSFSGMSRGEVEQKLSELKCLLIKNCCVGKGAVLYLEDIKWVAEFRANSHEARGGFYCPVEHVIMEIGRLVFSGINGGEDGGIRGGRFWLMGISTYQTYMRCKIGNPSLEIVWGLQPLTIPVGSLELSLNCDNCDSQSLHKSSISGAWPILEDTAGNQLTYCTNFPIKFEKDAQASSTSTLPSWLQHYKEKSQRDAKDMDCLNSINRPQNHTSEITLHFSSASPSSSISSYNHHSTAVRLSQRHHPWKQNQVWLSEGISRGFSNNSRAFPFSIANNSSSHNPNLTSTANTMDMENHHKFKEVNAENLKILCNGLERKVPWQKAIIPEIASTILQCRAGMRRSNKDDTWLFFQGGDIEGKEKIARELASLVFGYQTSFCALGLSSSSSTKSDSTDDVRNKRSRSEASHGFLEKLVQAVRENPHRVFLVEDIEQVDFHSQVGFERAIERGSFWSLEGGEVAVEDAIVILCCEAFDSRSRGCSPVKQKMERGGKGEEVSGKESDSYLCLDLNLCAADDDTAELWCGESERLLGAVDRAFFFKMPEEL